MLGKELQSDENHLFIRNDNEGGADAPPLHCTKHSPHIALDRQLLCPKTSQPYLAGASKSLYYQGQFLFSLYRLGLILAIKKEN